MILVLSASAALVAERLSAAPARSAGARADTAGRDDVSSFVTPSDSMPAPDSFRVSITVDPFGAGTTRRGPYGVASSTSAPTLSTSARGRRLTAILIADSQRVAVIDEMMVVAGDTLGDGAKIASIQPNQVWIVEKNGQWRALTLANPGR